jgi:hypothetical protein
MTVHTRKQVLGTLAVLVVLAGAGIVVGKARSPKEAPRQQVSTQGIELAGCPAPSRYGTAPRSVAGTMATFRVGAVPDNQAFDLRSARVVGFPEANRYPLLFGKNRPGRSTCLVGGTVEGQQSRDLTWQTMKRVFDGDGLSIKSAGGVVDGIRIDNLQDGIGTIGGDPGGITIRNVYMTYIRDDCLENDAIVQVTLRDSLLDGCYSAISERPGAGTTPQLPPPTETKTLDRVLIRLQPMPFNKERATCPGNAADGLGNSGFFKWSRYANRLVVKNSVLLAERNSVNCGSSLNLPRSGTYENVTLVWLGPGDYPGRVPSSGITVTRNRGVWDGARAEWLTRHGYAVD